MFKKIIALSIFILPLYAFAKPVEIQGALGYKFGEKIDVTKIENFYLQPEVGLLMIPVKPPYPIPEYFKDYNIFTSIKSFEIVMITATKKYKSETQCLNKKNKLLKIFKKSYPLENITEEENKFIVKGNNGKIDVRCKNGILLSMYIDENLGDKAIREWRSQNDKK